MVGRSGDFALSEDEVHKLLNSFDNIHEKAIFALATVTGIRRNDLVSIKRRDFDSNNGIITFFEHKKGAYHSIRIPSRNTISMLNEHLASCKASEWLFPSPRKSREFKNSHISGRHVFDLFNEHLVLAGLKERPLHSLRATCLQLSLAKGWNFMCGIKLLNIHADTADDNYDRRDCRPTKEDMKNAALDMSFDYDDSMRVAENHYNAPSRREMEEIAEEKPLF